MPKLLEIYKCEKCGNIVEMVHGGPGALVCCGEPMKLYKENTTDAAQEKHVPVIEKLKDGETKSTIASIVTHGIGGTTKVANRFKVTIGSVAHPMVDEHYIEWIELVADGKAYRQFLKPGDAPEAIFCVDAESITAREYCNVHGLWKKEGE
ncbi:MAG: desulfoferrodoxin FeS4 iron-binding domain-containing protein [Candidatus Coatesbacteria bacterium]|nr:desulfoferrodoxin FeS4 iron-binding domain-containing protein [Candidatus Coatesbacteria bacterium]